MKSVLFLIPNLGGGGAERVLVNLVNNLDKSKYEITVQTLFKAGVNEKILNSDVHIIEGKLPQFKGNVCILKLFSPESLYKFFIKKRYDIVISYLEGPTARIVAGCPYKDSGLISWIHVEQHNKVVASYAFKNENEALTCYNKYDKIICVANSVKKDFASIFNLSVPIQVIYNTNEDGIIREKGGEAVNNGLLSNELNIITVGRLVEAKGFDRLIDVHRKLLDIGIKHHIYVLGSGEGETSLKEKAKKLNVSNTFHFLGFQNNPYKYVSKADLFVCSSRREGFSTAVTEALILGVPVVSTCCSGAIELLGENDEYGIVTENSIDGIFDGMYKMLSNESVLRHYRSKAIERGNAFTKDKTLKAVEDLFEEILEINYV